MTMGRNDICRCGSGKKYKKCCLAGDEAGRSLAPIAPYISPSATTIDRLQNVLSETLPENRSEPRQSVPHDFVELAASVEEEIDWLAREGDADLDMALGWWLVQCKTVEQRQILEDRLARLRLEQPEVYFKQIPAFTALLRVINALELQRGDVIRRVVEDGERLVQGDNEANAYGHLVRLLGWHGELELMLRAVETAAPGIAHANLLRCEERIHAQWFSAGRRLLTGHPVQFGSDVPGAPADLLSEFMASQITQGLLPSQALLQTAEV
ncbi:MAG TPA: SEC-C metal-binding domain-containing protein, partial [Candidatus Xenobia bacterium]